MMMTALNNVNEFHMSNERNVNNLDWVCAEQTRLTKKRKLAPSVAFAPVITIVSTDTTTEELEESWYSRRELEVFKLERRALVKALKRVDFNLSKMDQVSYPLRGYEAYFSVRVNKEMKQRRAIVVQSVLGEQARQRCMGIVDHEMIKFVCSRATEWACHRASQLGVQDAVDSLIQKKILNATQNLPLVENPILRRPTATQA